MTSLEVIKPGMWAAGSPDGVIRGCIEADNAQEARKAVRDMGAPWKLYGLVLSFSPEAPFSDAPMTFSVSVDGRNYTPIDDATPSPYEGAIQNLLQSPAKFVKVGALR